MLSSRPRVQNSRPPFNRFLHQFARDHHHYHYRSILGKFDDLMIQIFGHETFTPRRNIDLEYCVDFKLNMYQVNRISMKQLAWRKLLNPFKWVEFLVVGILGLLNGTAALLLGLLIHLLDKCIKNDGCFYFLKYFIKFIHFPINLAFNVITGTARLFLAPVRYLIRPAIETARKHPYSFTTIVLLTVGVAIALLTGILPIPVLISQFLLTSTLAVKLSVVSAMSILQGAFLTKGLNTIYDLKNFFYGDYREENKEDSFYKEGNRSTARITHILHRIDIDNVEVRKIEDQDFWYTVSLSTGTEFLYRRRKQQNNNQHELNHRDHHSSLSVYR